mgnify:FL=1
MTLINELTIELTRMVNRIYYSVWLKDIRMCPDCIQGNMDKGIDYRLCIEHASWQRDMDSICYLLRRVEESGGI